jgi:endonuclease III
VSTRATPSSVLHLVTVLERFYGPLPSPPNDPFRYYVWEVLSTRTTSGRRDLAYAALRRIPALTPDSMFRAPRAKLAQAVAQAGPYQEQRIHALLSGVERFRRQPRLGDIIRGPLRAARRAAALLPHLGDEGSSHRLLLFGGNHGVFPVDRDIVRLCARLGILSRETKASVVAHAVRKRVEERLPREAGAFKRAQLYLQHHAVHTCTDDPHCTVCPLAPICPGRQA